MRTKSKNYHSLSGSCGLPKWLYRQYDIAKKLDERYFARGLPHKFKFGITGCQNNCLKAEENDVGIKGGIKVEWREADCIGCGVCVKTCRQGALTMEDGKIVLDKEKCNFCGRCFKACPTEAWDTIHGYIVIIRRTFRQPYQQGRNCYPMYPRIKTY